ncbi:MAG TPA: hypothetical protein VEO54_11015 [Thermoanaerobaculia bacterium]|nr:hypothetical protein [Thermoanaerobaculia bacterium]
MSRHFVLLGVLLFVCSCASQPSTDTIDSTAAAPGGTALSRAAGGNPCSNGVGSENRNAPIVCVDDTGSTLTVSPDPIRVHDVGASDRAPVVIHWHTVSGANDLNIEIEPGCVAEMNCTRGHCRARTTPRNDKTEKRCKYDVWTDKHPRLDPDMIIIPCC